MTGAGALDAAEVVRDAVHRLDAAVDAAVAQGFRAAEQLIVRLDQVLAEEPALAAVLDRLMAASRPGGEVAQDLRRRLDDREAERRRLLDGLAAADRELAETAAENEQLREQVERRRDEIAERQADMTRTVEDLRRREAFLDTPEFIRLARAKLAVEQRNGIFLDEVSAIEKDIEGHLRALLEQLRPVAEVLADGARGALRELGRLAEGGRRPGRTP